MINVYVYRNKNGGIYGFRSEGHGDPIVCAAASALTLNAVNSVETFTERDFVCEVEADGYLEFEIPLLREGAKDEKCSLILESVILGLRSLAEDNKNDIKIHDELIK